MGDKRYSEGLRHVSEFIPEPFKLAAKHARQVKGSYGQSKFQHTKEVCRYLREGLNDQSSS